MEKIETIAEALINRQWRLAVAESCTGGLIAHRLTNYAGSSAWFQGGIVAYSNEVKVNLLQVDRADIDSEGAVSPVVAAAMARNAARLLGAELGLSTTGVAGPGGGTPEKPVGLVYFALAHPDGIIEMRKIWNSDREGNKLASAEYALQMVVDLLLQPSSQN